MSSTRQGNTPTARGARVVQHTLAEEMNAYDALPPRIRHELAEQPLKVSAVVTLRQLQLQGEELIINALRWYHQITLAEWRDEMRSIVVILRIGKPEHARQAEQSKKV